MMKTLQDIREEHPQYADLSDLDLANKLWRKFYQDIPRDKFYEKVGVKFAPEYNASEGGGTFGVLTPFGTLDTGIGTSQTVDRTLAGIGRGMANVGRNIKNVVGVESDESLRDKDKLDRALMDTRAGSIGNMIGEGAAITPALMIGGAGLGALGKGTSMAARALGTPLGRGIAEGAAQGALTAGPDNRMQGAAFGGAAGSVLPLLGMAGRTAVRGVNRTPEAQLLLDRGVSLTPGQMNPRGMLNQVEESIQSVPVVGAVIRNARENAEQQFNRAAIQEGAMAPISSAAKTASEQLDSAYATFAPEYAKGKGFPVGATNFNTTPPTPIDKSLETLAKKARSGLTEAQTKRETQVIRDQLKEVIRAARRKGGMQSDDLFEFRSMLRANKRGFSGTDVQSKAMRELYDDAEKVVTRAIESHIPADASAAVRAADAKYGTYNVVSEALGKARDRPTGFTGTMLSQAVRENTPEKLYSRGGGGALRDLARAASNTFEVRSPATGARLATLLAAIGLPKIAAPAGAGLLALAGTQTGRSLAAGQTAAQKAMDKMLTRGVASLSETERALIDRYSRGLLVSSQVSAR